MYNYLIKLQNVVAKGEIADYVFTSRRNVLVRISRISRLIWIDTLRRGQYVGFLVFYRMKRVKCLFVCFLRFSPFPTLFQFYQGDDSLIHDPWVKKPVLDPRALHHASRDWKSNAGRPTLTTRPRLIPKRVN